MWVGGGGGVRNLTIETKYDFSRKVTNQTRFIAKSSAIEGEAICPLPAAPLSCFQKLHTEDHNENHDVETFSTTPNIFSTFSGSLYRGKRVTLEQTLQLEKLKRLVRNTNQKKRKTSAQEE